MYIGLSFTVSAVPYYYGTYIVLRDSNESHFFAATVGEIVKLTLLYVYNSNFLSQSMFYTYCTLHWCHCIELLLRTDCTFIDSPIIVHIHK